MVGCTRTLQQDGAPSGRGVWFTTAVLRMDTAGLPAAPKSILALHTASQSGYKGCSDVRDGGRFVLANDKTVTHAPDHTVEWGASSTVL